MADYNQTTFFAPKDALSSGNPSKLIKGTEVDPELAAIATAIATKYDDTDVASVAEAQALTSNAKLLTPARLLSAFVAGNFSTGVGLITSLTLDTALDSVNDHILFFSAADNQLRKTNSAAIGTAVGSVPVGRNLIAGNGLSGGGDLSADRTFDVGAGTGISVGADTVGLDTGSTRNTDHAAVSISAGTGLTGGGTIDASRTLSVDRSGTDATQVGFLDVPQIVNDASITFALSDRGKHYYKTTTTARTWTIPANSSVAFPIGTVITLINISSAGPVTIALAGGVSLLQAGTGSTGSRTLGGNALATIIKTGTDSWMINGSGIT